MMKRFLTLLKWSALLLSLVTLCLVSYDYWQTKSAFPPGTSISGIDVSWLTPDASMKKLKQLSLSQLYTPQVTLEADKQIFTFAPEQLGISVLYADSVEQAFAETHQGNYFEQLWGRLKKGAIEIPLIFAVDETTLRAVFQVLADEVRVQSKNAAIAYFEKTGGYNISGEALGRELNINRSLVRFRLRLAGGEKIIPLVIDYSQPRITEKSLREHPPAHLLSAYTTFYGSHDSPNRIHNIKLIASWIDGTLLMPGDAFSVAQILGDVTEERGFKEAYVIIQGELVASLGGGACQIATTLFNAVSLADLKIKQRRNHSFYFNIYPLGRDAAVYPGQVDFQFENDSGYPVLIKSVATDKRLSFRIYGTPSGKTVKFSEPQIFGYTKNGPQPMGLGTVIRTDCPFRTLVTRTVYDQTGQKIKEETLTSFYKLYGEKSNVPIRKPEAR
jgi:vancomycin resistance protein YoaR